MELLQRGYDHAKKKFHEHLTKRSQSFIQENRINVYNPAYHIDSPILLIKKVLSKHLKITLDIKNKLEFTDDFIII